MTIRLGGAKRSTPEKLAAATPLHEHPVVKATLAAHVSGASPLPASIDLSGSAPDVLDQGDDGDCTACAIACCLVIAFALAGAPLGFVPSQQLTYSATRELERADVTPPGQKLEPLTDSGAMIADVVKAVATVGVKPMLVQTSPDGRFSDVWGPNDGSAPPNVNNDADPSDVAEANKNLIDGPHVADLGAPNVEDVLAAALASNIPLDISFFADSTFMQIAPTAVAGAPDESDKRGGGHSVCLVGYRTNAAGEREWLLRNSWSKAWALAGMVWVGPAFRAAIWEVWLIAARKKVTS